MELIVTLKERAEKTLEEMYAYSCEEEEYHSAVEILEDALRKTRREVLEEAASYAEKVNGASMCWALPRLIAKSIRALAEKDGTE